MEIRDAVTLSLLCTFVSPSDYNPRIGLSPDNRFLTHLSGEGIVTQWHLKTGASVGVGTIPPKELRVGYSNFSSAYSMDGKMLAVVYSDQDFKNTFIATHDLFTTHAHFYRLSKGSIISPIWTHGKFIPVW